MTKKRKQPQLIEDEKLDEASGGVGMLLPAVQKIRDAANRSSSSNLTKTGAGTLAIGGDD